MKKICLFLLMIAFLSASTIAQNAGGRAFAKGRSVIAAGYGIGNIWRTLFVKSTNFPGGSYKIKSTGPFTLTYEYGISNRISAGLIMGYTGIKRLFYLSSYTNTEKFSNFCILARANYHFWRTAKFDPYVGIGAGYYKFKYSSQDDSGSSVPLDPVNIPGSFGYSGEIGVRYYFVPRIAAFTEIGYVAGSYVQAGIAASF